MAFRPTRDIHEYDDIIRLPHPASARHRPMTLLNRAAQFSPFAALTGYEDLVDETARLVDRRLSLSDEQLRQLNETLRELSTRLREEPQVCIVYFAQDPFKDGGFYRTEAGVLKAIDPVQQTVTFRDGPTIPMRDIYRVEA